MGLFIYPVFIGSSRGSLSRGGGFLELFVDPLDLAELELTQTKQTVRVVAVQAAWALRGISLSALYVPADHKHYRHMWAGLPDARQMVANAASSDVLASSSVRDTRRFVQSIPID